jgi:hypothetical protein
VQVAGWADPPQGVDDAVKGLLRTAVVTIVEGNPSSKDDPSAQAAG